MGNKVQGKYRPDLHGHELKVPGEFVYYSKYVDDVEVEFDENGYRIAKHAGMLFCCPCGCGELLSISLKPVTKTGWEWDGNIEAPTCSPSILHMDGCKWHGYLKKGIFEEC